MKKKTRQELNKLTEEYQKKPAEKENVLSRMQVILESCNGKDPEVRRFQSFVDNKKKERRYANILSKLAGPAGDGFPNLANELLDREMTKILLEESED